MKIFSKPQLSCFALLAASLLIGTTALAASPLVTLTAAQASTSSDLVLKPDHPERYTVVKGDTLWDISGMFLRDPWLWPEIWNVNPQIENPHLIYPGDVLVLVWVDGKPQLQLQRGAGNAEKLQPGVRISNAEAAVPTIPFDRISAFLTRAGVASKSDYNKLAKVSALPDGMVAGAGDSVYVRGLENPMEGELYRIIRLGTKLTDPDTGNDLGYEIVYVGAATVTVAGETSKLLLNDTTRESKVGDRVMQINTIPPLNVYPRGPEQEIDGQLVAVKDGVSMIGQYQMVIINRGIDDGLEQGHVLSIWSRGLESTDRSIISAPGEKFTLPDERIGLLLVLKPEENTSYALIMDATSEIRVLDRVRNP